MMVERKWVRVGGMSTVSNDGRRVASGNRYFMVYNRDGKILSIPVDHRYEGGIRDSEHFRSVLLIRPDMTWLDGSRLMVEELREMKEDLASALPVLGSKAVFITPGDEDL